MQTGIGYSDNPDTVMAGIQAAMAAMKEGSTGAPCDMVLLFATARHDAKILRQAVASVVGHAVPIIGGAAVGAISNDSFGYAGDQIILAAFWMEGVSWNIHTENNIPDREEEAGEKLGQRLLKDGVKEDSPVLLFYDSLNHFHGNPRLTMATPLLKGMENGLGFLPNLMGAGLQGDFGASPTKQWVGDEIMQHCAMALTFSNELRIDSTIMHGCRPSTGYYTVTKADGQVILEINGEPALDFLDKMFGGIVPAESYPFFLIFGINHGDKWADFDEDSYASRLCFGIDQNRRGIVMFEPDMIEGTEFQIMYSSLDLDYMPPRMEELFANLNGRKAVFALYINCAGRAAGYAGIDIEDAIVVQKATKGRVPLLGIYSGVEIASVRGKPRGLDWTGVFCLFSVAS